jgi:hypothetical protein
MLWRGSNVHLMGIECDGKPKHFVTGKTELNAPSIYMPANIKPVEWSF